MPFDEYCQGGFTQVKREMAKVRERGYGQAAAVEVTEGPPIWQEVVDTALLAEARRLSEIRMLDQPRLTSWIEDHKHLLVEKFG